MTDEEKITAVTAKLTGEFYIGQRVKTKAYGSEGVVECIGPALSSGHRWISVRLVDKTCPPYLEFELIPL